MTTGNLIHNQLLAFGILRSHFNFARMKLHDYKLNEFTKGIPNRNQIKILIKCRQFSKLEFPHTEMTK